jgi:tetratricopeptide (TPR) repeat protein
LTAKIQTGYVEFWGKGDTRALRRTLADVPVDPDGVVTSSRWEGAMMERDFAGAMEVLNACSLAQLDYLSGGATPKSFLIGLTQLASGDEAGASGNLEAAAVEFERSVRESPESAERHANLGLCYAFLRRKDDAIREGRRAVELKPESKDAFDGAIMNCYLALIYARVREFDLAFPLLERLMKTAGAVDSVNCSVTASDLKFRWEWDEMRKDPRFARLIRPES